MPPEIWRQYLRLNNMSDIILYANGKPCSGKTRLLNEIKNKLSNEYKFVEIGEHSIACKKLECINATESEIKSLYGGHMNLAEMVKTHIDNWRNALESIKKVQLSESDCSYIDHELRALRDIENAVNSELGL